ncbi:hypothetical protein B296_00022551 [Ensete ventricosum]|uniref:Uncharacterized protein n=1 Tax=Ensete ventricosum TaxID=4639 RepID=A0A426XVC0_ENSVE|nr:hypothetical protein B296_00022551 [Ensete ventricosum]
MIEHASSFRSYDCYRAPPSCLDPCEAGDCFARKAKAVRRHTGTISVLPHRVAHRPPRTPEKPCINVVERYVALCSSGLHHRKGWFKSCKGSPLQLELQNSYKRRRQAKRAEHIAILNTIIQVLHEEDLGALVSSSSSSHLPGTKKPRVSACTGRSTPPLRFASNLSRPATIPETP